MARILRDDGYATGLFGKWHLGYQRQFGPNAHGFDEFFRFLDWSIDYYSHRTPTGLPGLYEDTMPTEQEGYMTGCSRIAPFRLSIVTRLSPSS